MSRLEQLQKAVEDALEEIQKASYAWYAYGAAYGAADAAVYDSYYKAMQELEDYVEEYGYE